MAPDKSQPKFVAGRYAGNLQPVVPDALRYSQAGTPMLVLHFRIYSRDFHNSADAPDWREITDEGGRYPEKVYLRLKGPSWPYTKRKLALLGWNGELEPELVGFSGTTINLECTVESGRDDSDDPFLSWDIELLDGKKKKGPDVRPLSRDDLQRINVQLRREMGFGSKEGLPEPAPPEGPPAVEEAVSPPPPPPSEPDVSTEDEEDDDEIPF